MSGCVRQALVIRESVVSGQILGFLTVLRLLVLIAVFFTRFSLASAVSDTEQCPGESNMRATVENNVTGMCGRSQYHSLTSVVIISPIIEHKEQDLEVMMF